jgi:hypothetical protein
MMTKVQHNHPAQKKFSQHYQPTEISSLGEKTHITEEDSRK